MEIIEILVILSLNPNPAQTQPNQTGLRDAIYTTLIEKAHADEEPCDIDLQKLQYLSKKEC